MKHSLRCALAAAFLSGGLGLTVHAGDPSPGCIDFGSFTPPGGGRQFVEVNIGRNLISLVARLAEPHEAEVSNLLRGLESVRVIAVGLDDSNRAEIQERVKRVRAELDRLGWERLVTAQQKGDDVGVYLKLRHDEAVEGLVVTVIEGNGQAVFVNIIGDLRPEQLATVGERLHLEPLQKIGQAIQQEPKATEP